MPNFLFVYHGGGRPESQEDIDRVMAAWGKWMEDNGASLVEPGNPVGMSKTVSSGGVADDGGANPASGYTIVSAADIDAACAIAKSNPMVLDGSGSVEVAEIMQM
ncbi:YciI family protein [Sedimentitalea nanhaiensis]|uniref:YCII-related domain-containing protein n=1 Tax=Sedimentitalea nanhaiensis TaxID=999627 RepID=A0A1I6XC01_9RHOB|nr:YciI family protein [Sedimentitalea nanhaiensis]SFT35354.1 YCII-related domain-containing protein [Sedimentitalea nanhaiensis]